MKKIITIILITSFISCVKKQDNNSVYTINVSDFTNGIKIDRATVYLVTLETRGGQSFYTPFKSGFTDSEGNFNFILEDSFRSKSIFISILKDGFWEMIEPQILYLDNHLNYITLLPVGWVKVHIKNENHKSSVDQIYFPYFSFQGGISNFGSDSVDGFYYGKIKGNMENNIIYKRVENGKIFDMNLNFKGISNDTVLVKINY